MEKELAKIPKNEEIQMIESIPEYSNQKIIDLHHFFTKLGKADDISEWVKDKLNTMRTNLSRVDPNSPIYQKMKIQIAILHAMSNLSNGHIDGFKKRDLQSCVSDEKDQVFRDIRDHNNLAEGEIINQATFSKSYMPSLKKYKGNIDMINVVDSLIEFPDGELEMLQKHQVGLYNLLNFLNQEIRQGGGVSLDRIKGVWEEMCELGMISDNTSLEQTIKTIESYSNN